MTFSKSSGEVALLQRKIAEMEKRLKILETVLIVKPDGTEVELKAALKLQLRAAVIHLN
jgi:hypothetical protein